MMHAVNHPPLPRHDIPSHINKPLASIVTLLQSPKIKLGTTSAVSKLPEEEGLRIVVDGWGMASVSSKDTGRKVGDTRGCMRLA
jgi:hypothetical protein